MQWQSLKQVTRAHKARKTNNQWFDTSSCQFFGTKFHTDIMNGRFFVTSEENFHGNLRTFSIRAVMDDASITTPAWQAFLTLESACRRIGQLQRNPSPCANCRERLTFNPNFVCDVCEPPTFETDTALTEAGERWHAEEEAREARWLSGAWRVTGHGTDPATGLPFVDIAMDSLSRADRDAFRLLSQAFGGDSNDTDE